MLLLSIDWTNLHELLRSLYDEMMPLCEDMASVAKGVAANEKTPHRLPYPGGL